MKDAIWPIISVALLCALIASIALSYRPLEKSDPLKYDSVRIEAQRIELMGAVYMPAIKLPDYPPSPPLFVYPEVTIKDPLPEEVKARLMAPHQVSVTSNPPNVTFIVPDKFRAVIESPEVDQHGERIDNPIRYLVIDNAGDKSTVRDATPQEITKYRAALKGE